MGDARYLYCIAESCGREDMGDIGIDGNRVYTISCMGLAAVVHDCHDKAFGHGDEEAMKAYLLGHQRVVQIVRERFGTVLPLGYWKIIISDGHKRSEEKIIDWLKG
ncbi:MAG: GvpL/GvpF family gas vesicle protein, partial [Deltaproteobacteria bacterium]|nr:GvpL/GvpF family gas vesicle protein [Deltaproteobacteria bacterium]